MLILKQHTTFLCWNNVDYDDADYDDGITSCS
jgi:hypothetical protein